VATSGSHVRACRSARVGAQLCPGSLATRLRRRPSARPLGRRPGGLRSWPLRLRAAAHCTQPRSARFEPVQRLRGLHTGSSRTPSGLACQTRAVRQCRRVPSCRVASALPGSGCPSFYRTAERPGGGGLHLHSVTQNFVVHQPVVVRIGIVDAVRVGRQSLRQAAQLDQLMPSRPARASRDISIPSISPT
jgi:hypothetical protein